MVFVYIYLILNISDTLTGIAMCQLNSTWSQHCDNIIFNYIAITIEKILVLNPFFNHTVHD